MPEPFELKPISKGAVGEAIHKAEQYRALNDPEQAESICLDILRVDPENQAVLVLLILSITDQLGSGSGAAGAQRAREIVARLNDQYQRFYYSGIVCERQARALLTRGTSSGFAYEGFREAMEWYAKAEPIRPPQLDDAILRWNSCARTIRRHHLRARPREHELPLE